MSQSGSFFTGSGPGGFVQTLTGNTGGPVPPTGFNINVVGSGVVSVAGNPGTSTLTISVSGAVADSFPTDSGTATPVAGVLNVFGGNNISTSGAGNTITIDVTGTTNHSLQLGNASGSLTSLGVATNGQLPIGSTGADPVLATLTAGTGISITSGPGSITIASSALTSNWHSIAASQPLVENNSYLCSGGGALSLSLPGSSSFGDEIEVVLDGSASWTITQGAGQQIRLGNQTTTLGAGGSLASTAQGDSIRMVCKTGNTLWTVLSVIGNITVV